MRIYGVAAALVLASAMLSCSEPGQPAVDHVLPSISSDLICHYDFDHPVAGNPSQESDIGRSGTELDLVNGGAAMRVDDAAYPDAGQSLQTRQVNPTINGNDDWKAGVFDSSGIATLSAFSGAREITLMGWVKPTGGHPSPNSLTEDPNDTYNAIGLFGILSGNSDGHNVRALLEVINVSGTQRLVALGRRDDEGNSLILAADEDWETLLPEGAWTHLSATFDFDNGTMALYRNGERLQASYTAAQDRWAIAGDPEPDVTSPSDPAGIKIGGSFPQNSSEKNAFNGRFDDLMFFDRELTATEIRNQFLYFRSASAVMPIDPIVSEGFANPVGFYDATPSFSWKLPATGEVSSQSAYRVVAASDPTLLPDAADLWDSGKVASDQSTWVNYDGSPLASRQAAYWQVMFWDQDGNASDWSSLSSFELGLLENEDWQARWISLPESNTSSVSGTGYPFHRPQYLRKDFSLHGDIEKARLYITARGVFEAEINGRPIGNDVLTPGWTPYDKRVETLTYDVTGHLVNGDNTIGIMLAPGWYSGRIAYRRSYAGERPVPQAISQLEILYRNGERVVINSDGSWTGTANGPIRMSDIYEGEDYDASYEMPGWSSSGFDAGDWIAVQSADVDPGVRLFPKRHAAIRNKDRLRPIDLSEPEPGKLVFDFGQNMVGIPELNIPVKAGQTVSVRFAEMLEEDGTLYTANYRSARSADFFKPAADGVIQWQPTFTFHGFRYIELSGFDADAVPNEGWVTGVVQYSDFERRGKFISSHAMLNRLQSNITWGLKGNFLDIPTDCPQRDERMGWTGDAQVFAPTSLFNSDVHAFWASWLQSARDEQFADGGIPHVIPNNRGNDSSAGWADAVTIIPWETYRRTGDKQLLADNYDMMRGLVDYYRLTPNERIGALQSFGDWLQPYSQNQNDSRRGDTPNELIEAAYFARSVDLTIKAADVLGYDDEVDELQPLLDTLRDDFVTRFLDSDGRLTTPVETQTAYLLTLGFDLIPADLSERVVPHLLRTIAEADNHLRTGFLGTPLLAPVLNRYGHTDLMYELLFKETYPSWFYSINQGATTMWERWNSYSHDHGFGDANMNSFNHYAYGAIGEWMYEGIAGIVPLEPGYKKSLIAPTPGGPLEFASAEYNSMYGRIASNWQKTENGLTVDVTVPPNTSATVVIPLSAASRVSVNGGDISDSPGIESSQRNDDSVVMEVSPGTYSFETQNTGVQSSFIYDTAPYPSSHASTIEETEAGLVAAWFGGMYEQHPDVGIWLSHYEDGQWTTPVEVANGVVSPDERYPTWNPVLFQTDGGPLLLFYKVGPSPSTWWGMQMSSSDGGKTWSEPVRLPDGILGPIKNKPIQLSNGDILSPTSTEHDGWRVHFERSTDGGLTWVATDPVNAAGEFDAIQPSLLAYGDGRLQALGRTRNFRIFSIWSDDGGQTWGDMKLLELPNPSSGTDAVTLQDGRQLLVYNHNLREGTTNKGRSPLNVAISDDGINWSAALVLEDEPDAPSGFAYPAVIQTSDGLVHVTYTWQRKRIRHAVFDPAQLALKPIVDGHWPDF